MRGPEAITGPSKDGVALAQGATIVQTRAVQTGERMMIRCEGGPTAWRAATYPPPGEFVVDDGIYVLIDDGTAESWSYEFVPDGADR